jgi:hypothetical protein
MTVRSPVLPGTGSVGPHAVGITDARRRAMGRERRGFAVLGRRLLP